MAMGIMDTVQLAATLVFAVPVAVFGVTTLMDGNTLLGGGLVVVAALMVLLPRHLTTPADVPGKVAERAVGKAVTVPDDGETDADESRSG